MSLGGQIVFSSVNTGTDFSHEGRIINMSMLRALENGLGNNETSIFPIVIWKVKEGVNWSDNDFNKAIKSPEDAVNGKMEFESPNFDLFMYSCKVASKRLFPTYLFLDASFNKHEEWDINDPERYKKEVACMGCRTRVFENINGPKTSWGRGNISFSTLNLVRIALEANKKYPKNKNKRLEFFFKLLEERSSLICEQLYERFKYQSEAKAKQFPFLFGQNLWEGGSSLSPDDTVGDIIKSGTLGLGYIGLAECLKSLTGKHHGESEESQELGIEIITKMNEVVSEYKEKYHLNYSVLATPAEGLSGKFTVKDKKEFGIVDGVTDREFYTNSCHIPTYYNISAYDKIKKESVYHKLSPGGHILYVEMDTDAQKNLHAFMSIIKTMKDNNAGYGAINVPSCRCLKCGYDKPFEDKCPACGETEQISVIKRITGYLVGTINRWNSAKKAEEKARVKHGI